jgi:glycerol-3-phosphate dehydrogenase (NAD(P)+)
VHSRNHTLGERIAAGMTIEAALAASPMVAEGYRTAKSAHALAKRERVEMPITAEVYSVLYEGASPRDAVLRLMTRGAKSEHA